MLRLDAFLAAFVATASAAVVALLVLDACDDAACVDCGAAGSAGAAPARACPESGVLYGPWALHFDETSAIIRWDGCAAGSTDVTFEPEAGGAAVTVSGTQTPAEVQTSFELVANVLPDVPGTYYTSEVRLEGLEAGSCYRYRLGVDASRGGRLCTAKPAGEPFKLLVIGDTNPSFGDTAGVFDHALSDDLDFILHLGDIQYYSSFIESWAAWFPQMERLLGQGAFMPCVGNHEYENDHEFQDYYARLFGGAGFDSDAVEYYRFQSGGVWFFSISTESDLDPGTPQAEWLEEQLADAAAQPGYRFGVVYMHKPMMTLADFSQRSGERAHFEPLFLQYGVKLVLTGHVHGYERFDAGDLTYVVSGGGGALLHDLDARIADRPEEAALRMAAASRYHALTLEVDDAELRGAAISHEGESLDEFSIPLP
jgi:hypothetical protein